MRFHCGKTKDTGMIKFGPIATGDGRQTFKEHPIERWFGFSGADARWFVGIIISAPSQTVRVPVRSEIPQLGLTT